MSELAVAAQSGSSPLTTMLRRTVAVVDMVGYSDVARMLEQNISALSVADLNRQIQSFITRSLDRLPNQQAFCVVSRPGDGIILLFESANDAHDFAYHVHLFAAEHNNERSESTAERWFRIGLSTGDVTSTACADQAPEYAGITIANAVRLESKAKSGEILIDLTTFDLLPLETKLLYASGRAVPGKRKELFHARSFRVSCPRVPSRIPTHPLMTRRVFLGAAAATVASGTLAAWLERDRLYARMHPLPDIRHIALMAWPPPSKEAEAMLAGIIESIHTRLAHAEAYTEKFMIVTADEVAQALVHAPAESTSGHSPQATAEQWGANLILAAHLTPHPNSPSLELKVLDTTGNKLYRQDRVTHAPKEISRLASDSAARLLDLPVKEIEISDEAELAKQPAPARTLYDEAKLLAKDPNHTKNTESIEKFIDLVNAYPNFSLAYSGLGSQYLTKYKKSHETVDLEIAGQNLAKALSLNPDSEKAKLSEGRFLLASGKPEAALDQLSSILHRDPLNTEALFSKAQAYHQLNRPKQQEAVYRELISKRPNFWFAYNDLGNLFHDQGKNEEATELYRKAVALAPRATIPLINLGSSYFLLGRNIEAGAAFEQSNKISPNETAFENLGNIAFQKKDYPSALNFYLQAQALSPSDYYALVDLGDTYEKLGQPQKTQECYRKAADLLFIQLKNNPNDGAAWMTLAFYHAKTQDYESAESEIRTAEQHGASDVESVFLKARCWMLSGRTLDAEKLLLTQCRGLPSTEVELAPEFDMFRSTAAYKKNFPS